MGLGRIVAARTPDAAVSVTAPRRGAHRSTVPALRTGSVMLAVVGAAVVGVGVTALDRSGGLLAGLAAGRAELLAPPVLLIVAVGLVAERLWPAERRRLLARGHVQDATFFLFHVVVVVALMTVFSAAFASLLAERARWMAGPWQRQVPAPVLLGLTFVLMDAANWAAHWADHRVETLWRMHALHHSQEELSVLTSFRAHPLSHLPGFLLAAVPAFALAGFRGLAPTLIVAYVCLGTLPHANVRWSYGPLGKIVVSPAYHRLHHEFDGAPGVNLGVVLTVWDRLAGRARFPDRDPTAPPIRTGLPGRPVPVEQAGDAPAVARLLARQLWEPFRPTALPGR